MTNSQRFTDRANSYALHRPSYPPQALDALFRGLGAEDELVVADIGAGTGIATRQLAQRVHTVIAIEPNAAMRERAQPLPNVSWQDGTAEHTALPDKSVDVAVAFQAFHWFDAVDAVREFRRIARQRIGLVQYERNEAQPLAAAYGGIVRRYASADTEALRARALEAFATLAGDKLRTAVVPFRQRLTLDGLIGRVKSTSYLPQDGHAAEHLQREVEAAFNRFQRAGAVELALTVHVLAAPS
jgi:ubiquinone/menaquinone biosynthesis C-methylase UbiE